MKTHAQLEKEMPARLLSAACAIIAVIHFYNSSGKADLVLLGFVALCAIPWMSNIFESISTSGWKYRIEQGEIPAPISTTQKTPPTAPATPTALVAPILPIAASASSIAEQPSALPVILLAPIEFSMLTNQEKKVLATLWKYQKTHFPRNSEQRWTFTVGQGSPQYLQFSYGFLLLGAKGLVTVATTGHIFLTNQGFEYCQSRDPEISRWPVTYDNFSN